jgi:hypothetical protein
MLIEYIILAVLICSFAGVLLILTRKLPVLNSLPQNGTTGIRRHHIILNIEEKIRNILVYFEKQILLHKFLSWVKVMTLRIETKTDALLHKLRRKAQEVDKNKK